LDEIARPIEPGTKLYLEKSARTESQIKKLKPVDAWSRNVDLTAARLIA
jgi:hypothetical protein